MEGLLTNQDCITSSLHLPQRGSMSTEIKARTAHNKTCLVLCQRPPSPFLILYKSTGTSTWMIVLYNAIFQ
jgi:hypothetical protein